MKTILPALLAVCFLPILSFGQSTEDHSALKSLIGQATYDQIAELGEKRINTMAYLNRNGYYVSDLAGQKDISAYPNALEVEPMYTSAPALSETLISSGNIDLLGYKFKDSNETYVYYRIGDSGKLLVILPIELVLNNMNTQKEL